MKLGSTDISKVYLGSTEVSKAYLGSVQVHGGATPVLPYDAEVEYLQSNGKAFINSHFAADGDLKIKIRLVDYFTSTYEGKWAFGGRNGSNNKMFGLYINGNSGVVTFAYNNSQITLNHYSSYPSTCDVEIGDGTIKIGTTTHTYTKASFRANYNVVLFLLNNGGSIAGQGTQKIGATSFTLGNTTHEWIAVRKDGVGYLYNKTTDTLCGNDNSQGAFTIGPDKTT